MAQMASATATFQNLPGELDIAWYRRNNFSMGLTFSYDTTPYTYEAKVVDKTGKVEVEMSITPQVSGVHCDLTGDQIDALPSQRNWFLDEIDAEQKHTTRLAGLFTIRERGFFV
jgi:hypothetical protein